MVDPNMECLQKKTMPLIEEVNSINENPLYLTYTKSLQGKFDEEEKKLIHDLFTDQIDEMTSELVIAEIILYIASTINCFSQIDPISEILKSCTTEKSINWKNVYSLLPKTSGSQTKIKSISALAFLVAFYKSAVNGKFPTEVLYYTKWLKPHMQSFFLRDCIYALYAEDSAAVAYINSLTSVPNISVIESGLNITGTSTLQSFNASKIIEDPHHNILKDLVVAFDEELINGLQSKVVGPIVNRMWSNGLLLGTVLELASERNVDSSSNSWGENDEKGSSRIACEILRLVTICCPGIALATIIHSSNIQPNPGRIFATELLGIFKNYVQLSSSEMISYFHYVASLNPSKFVSHLLKAAYTLYPDKLSQMIFALKLDNRILLKALYGPPAPFRFYLLHSAWSSEFNSGLWLQERLKHDPFGKIAKEFLLFLILTLCPPEILQQQLYPHAKQPIRRLSVSRQELTFYLLSIVNALKDPNGYSAPNIPQNLTWKTICNTPPDVLNCHLYHLKKDCAMLLPQLDPFITLISPSSDTFTNEPAAKNPERPQFPLNESAAKANAIEQTLSSDNTLIAESVLEQEVHRYFGLLYTGSMTCDTLVELMSNLSASPPKSQKYQVFNYIIQLIFHECRFFVKYPLTELAVTAQLMGKMIYHEILVGHGPQKTAHMMAIRCVIEALRKGDKNKMFRFGVTALEQFVGPIMLCSPDFVTALIEIPEIREHYPMYIIYAEECLKLMPPQFLQLRYIDSSVIMQLKFPAAPPPYIHPQFSLTPYCIPEPEVTNGTSIISSAMDALNNQKPAIIDGQPINFDVLGSGSVEQVLSAEPALWVAEPPRWYMDKIAQTFNCLSSLNIKAKAEELRSTLQPEYLKYLALYIVKSRALKELNLQTVYVEFLERLRMPKLFDMVLAMTYDCINVLLMYCDAAKNIVGYRSIFKTLGSWLGNLTLAQNIPLRGKSLDIKALIFDGYENGRLKVLLPLCCRILEGIGQSKSFKPPNPWSVGIFNILAEVHALPNLVTFLSFEIEILFNKLKLEFSDYSNKSNQLTKRKPPVKDSPDFNSGTKAINKNVDTIQQPTKNTAQQQAPPNILDPQVTSALLQQPSQTPSTNQGNIQQPPLLSSQPTTQQPPIAPHMQILSQMQKQIHMSQQQQQHISAYLQNNNQQQQQQQQLSQTPIYPSNDPPMMQFAPTKVNIQAIARDTLATDADLVSTFDPIAGMANSSFTSAKQSVETPPNLLAILMKSVVVSPSLALFQLKPFLKSIVPHAIELAIKEVLQVVCEKSVFISSFTTKEIVLKDFSGELNDSLVRRAAYLMAASLAGSLALVTCRDSLRKSICQHIKNMLLAASSKLSEDQRLIDQVVSVIASDNIELGCSVIEEAVIQKALHRIEELIAPDLMERRRAKAMGAKKYQDPNYPTMKNSSAPCFSQKIQVYKDFLSFGSLKRMQSDNFIGNQTRFPDGCSEFQNSNNLSSNVADQNSSNMPMDLQNLDISIISTQVDDCLSSLKELIQEIAFCFPIIPYKFGPDVKYAEPAHHIVQFKENLPAVNTSLLTLSRLNSDHDLFSLIFKLTTICTLCVEPKTAFLSTAQKILKMLTDAAALHHEPLMILKNSDVAGLYVETCFSVLACSINSEHFPKDLFETELNDWVANFLEDKRSGAIIALNTVRYKISTFEKLNKIIVKKLASTTEWKTLNVVSNVLLILHKIINGLGIIIEDKLSAINAMKDCEDFVRKLQIPDNFEESTDPFQKILSQTVVLLDNTQLVSFVNARTLILEQIDATRASPKKITPSCEEKEHVIETVIELFDNYATFGGAIYYTRKYPLPPEIPSPQFDVIAARFHQWMFCYLIVSTEKRTKVWADYFQRLSKQRLLQMDTRTDFFLIGCLDRAIQLTLTETPSPVSKDISSNSVEQPLQVEVETPNLKPLDAFAKMIVAMMKLIDSSQISLVLILQRALSVIVRCMHRDSQPPNTFNPIVYNRLFLSLLWEIVQPNQGLDDQIVSFMLSFANAFQAVNPCVIPAFAFCWVELISHKSFLPKILKQHREWSNFQSLLTSLFRFLYCFLQRGKFSNGVNLLYKGTLRLLSVLLHDYSEILCDNYIVLSENLPLNCVQLRNIILSAVPHDIKLPNPFTSTLNVESLPESRKPLKLPNHLGALLIKKKLKYYLDEYAKNRDTSYLDQLLEQFKLTKEQEIATLGYHYDLPSIHAVLLLAASTVPIDNFNLFKNDASTQVLAVQIILYFMNNMDPEGRYVLISAISNQLRYPNMYTYYFSCLLLYLFSVSTKKEFIQEQITRVLLERLVTHRPHPWGILITFIELIKNPRFNFWNCSFVHSVPEVHKLFQSVAQTSFGQTNPIPQQNGEDRQIEIF